MSRTAEASLLLQPSTPMKGWKRLLSCAHLTFHANPRKKKSFCNFTPTPTPCSWKAGKIAFMCTSGHFIQFLVEFLFAACSHSHDGGGLENIIFLCRSGYFIHFLGKCFWKLDSNPNPQMGCSLPQCH